MRAAWALLVVGALVGGWLLLGSPQAEVTLEGDESRSIDCRPLALRGQAEYGLLGSMDPGHQDVVREHLEALGSTSTLTAPQVDAFEADAEQVLERACDEAREQRTAGLVLAAVPMTAGLSAVLLGAARRREDDRGEKS